MALFGSFATIRSQAPVTPAFSTAWEYVEQLFKAGSTVQQRASQVPVGESRKIELLHGVFVLEQAYNTKARPESFFESHRKYIDVQVIIDGEELMEVVDIARATVREPYLEARDFIAYEDIAASVLRLRAGDIAVYFPPDVHMGALRAGPAASVVRKAVLKLPVGG